MVSGPMATTEPKGCHINPSLIIFIPEIIIKWNLGEAEPR